MRQVLAGLLVVASGVVQAGAEGDIQFAGASWSVADARAYACDEGNLCVALFKDAVDDAAFMADGGVDTVDVWERTELGSVFLILTLDAEGALLDVAANGPDGSVNQHDESMLAAHSEGQVAGGGVAGRLDYDADGDRIQVTYDLPISPVPSSE